MENVVLGLSVAVAVVLVLLLSCWKSDKPKKRVNTCAADRVASQAAAASDVNIDNKARTGTAVLNREASNRYGELLDLERYDDFNSVAQFMSLEPEVYDSHSRYAKDMGRSTSGPSMMSERDDPNDTVPWVARKPDYQGAFVQPGARQEHSEYPDQMRPKTYYVIG
jgi:hypothetical protein